MAETGKKAKAPSTPRAAKKTTNSKKTGMAELVTMPSPAPAPTHEQIVELARRYWAERGYVDGYEEQDWLRAEQELSAKTS